MVELTAKMVKREPAPQGKLLTIKPPYLHFPVLSPFRIGDTFNGPHRGTWWFMDRSRIVKGPFESEGETQAAIADWERPAPMPPHHGGFPDRTA